MRLIAVAVVYAGLPGFLLGLAVGIMIRRWAALLLIAVAGGLAVRYTVQHVASGSSGDNDPAVIVMVALVANFLGFLVGAACGRLLTRRGQDYDRA
jgi:hypothetical protein